MTAIFLTHTPDMLANYYGERALAALRELGDVRLNGTGQVLDAHSLAQAAAGCEIVVSDRQTPGPAEFFALCPDLVAFLRVAVDIRNIDVAAASRAGILVTHATPGFVESVAEMAIGFMVDLGRRPRPIMPAACPRRAWAANYLGQPSASSAMARLGNIWRRCAPPLA
jgi:D-3-phosphoglycerate dehydrogenase